MAGLLGLFTNDEFVVPAHPIWQQEGCPVVFAMPAIASVNHERIAIPFHHRPFIRRQQRQCFAVAVAIRG
jgi:hypothetical protein